MPARKAASSEAAGSGTDQAPEVVGAGLGEVAYAAYAESVGGKSIKGEKLPDWSEVDPKIAVAWSAAAQAVITATISRKD